MFRWSQAFHAPTWHAFESWTSHGMPSPGLVALELRIHKMCVDRCRSCANTFLRCMLFHASFAIPWNRCTLPRMFQSYIWLPYFGHPIWAPFTGSLRTLCVCTIFCVRHSTHTWGMSCIEQTLGACSRRGPQGHSRRRTFPTVMWKVSRFDPLPPVFWEDLLAFTCSSKIVSQEHSPTTLMCKHPQRCQSFFVQKFVNRCPAKRFHSRKATAAAQVGHCLNKGSDIYFFLRVSGFEPALSWQVYAIERSFRMVTYRTTCEGKSERKVGGVDSGSCLTSSQIWQLSTARLHIRMFRMA